MSIKSQKSLNDEFSEIFEKSYSVRSVSDESLSCEDEEECLALELMGKLTPPVLSKLRRCFRRNRERSQAQDIDRRVEEVMRLAAAEEGIEFAASAPPPEDSLWLDQNAFVASLDNIFGHHKYSTHAEKLFQLLDAFGTGKVWWRQLVAKLVAVGARKTRSRAEVWTPITEAAIIRLDHCKRETIVKMVCVEAPGSFCYVVVSKGGRVGVYSGQLQLLHFYEMFYHRTGVRRRVKNRWITDAVYLSDVQYMLMSASDRSLSIYDATTVAHSLLYCITGLPNIPTCLAYSPSWSASCSSDLALGTERGDVMRVRFLRPRVQLLHNNTTDAVNHYFWMELSSAPHSQYCSVSVRRRAHARCVRRVRYSRGGALLLSCARQRGAALRAKHVPGKMDDLVYNLHVGVSCFHAVAGLQLLAAGGADGAVRLWGAAPARPYAKLLAPAPAPVLDVAVIPAQEIVIAFCSNCMVHIWDLYEECLLQSIKIKFPFLGVLGKKVEFGTYCIHPGPARREPELEVQEAAAGAAGAAARRGSSVYPGSTGGLLLQPQRRAAQRRLEEEPEYVLYNRSELLVTCCDHVCVVSLSAARGDVTPPPGDTPRPRRPSAWDLPDYPLKAASPPPARSPRPRAAPLLLSPATAYTADLPTNDLDTLLENAGLNGILEKDFVLMQGLKNDLNRKLAEIEANKDAPVSRLERGGHAERQRENHAPRDPAARRPRRPRRPRPATQHHHSAVMRRELSKRLLDFRSLLFVARKQHSGTQDNDDIFKFYSDDVGIDDRYKPLTERDYDRFISTRSARREPAITRQITSLAYKVGKEMISLAEGMPNEEMFPFDQMTLRTRDGDSMVMEGADLAAALQYVPSQGLPSLLSELRKFEQELHRPPPLPVARDVLVTNGGQHGIYQCAELLLEPGDPVITTEYAYTGLHSVLKPYQAEIIGIAEDEHGLVPCALEAALAARRAGGRRAPRLLYCTPTGSNPSGAVLPAHRRRRLYELACRHDFIILEDDPYMFLNYTDRAVPSFLSMDVCGRVIRLDSVSKVVSAGLRGAWLSAPAPLLRRLELHAQAELLHPCTLAQAILARVVSDRARLARHVRAARQFYRRRRDALAAALRPLRDLALADYHVPDAGLFLWMRLRAVDDVYNMVFQTAFQRGLMLVPGHAFLYDTNVACQYLRLTFSKIRYEDMDVAASHLADIIREEQQRALNKPKRLATEG